jgi:hypothetical protein
MPFPDVTPLPPQPQSLDLIHQFEDSNPEATKVNKFFN